MKLKNKKIGFILTGSFCTFKNTISQMKKIVEEGAEVIPIMSKNAYELDTRFGDNKEYIEQIEKITNKKIINTIQSAELIGTQHLTDIMIIAPASGNTIAKLANGITDNTVTVATKYHLRNNEPVVLAISTNDGLSRKCRKYR